MKEKIYTIPVNEIFEVKDGCPICRMARTLELKTLDFIMGDAMMEPDIRIETNRVGFCARHFSAMLARKNRLSLALMLETRLAFIDDEVLKKGGLFRKDTAARASGAAGGCYVCSHVDSSLDRLIDTLFKLWKKEPEFRANVAAQPMLCLKHYTLLLQKGRAALGRKEADAFEQTVTQVFSSGLAALRGDIAAFCKMYDYRSNGQSFGDVKDAPDRAVAFLTGLNEK